MVHSNELENKAGVEKRSQWLNEFQIMTKLGLTADAIKTEAGEKMFKSTLASLPQKPHTIDALRADGVLLYEWSEEMGKESSSSKERLSVHATGSAASCKSKAAPPHPPGGHDSAQVVLNYQALCNAARSQAKKHIKDLEKMHSKVRCMVCISNVVI